MQTNSTHNNSTLFPSHIFGTINLLIFENFAEPSEMGIHHRLGFHQSSDLPKNPSKEYMKNGILIKGDRHAKRTTPKLASISSQETTISPTIRVFKGDESDAWSVYPQKTESSIADKHNLQIRPNFDELSTNGSSSRDPQQKSVLTAIIQSLLTVDENGQKQQRYFQPFEVELEGAANIQEPIENDAISICREGGGRIIKFCGLDGTT